jgi:uncharacterized membrane protein YjgN (DUF898 family)
VPIRRLASGIKHCASIGTPLCAAATAANRRMDDYSLANPLSGRSARVVFAGERRDFIRLVRRGALLELVTAGFYRFWLATDIRRVLWSGTSIEGDAAEYTGTARELLIGFLFALAILVPIYLVYFLIGIEVERAKAFASLPLFLFFYAFGQFAIFRARRYRATRTVWRGVRFWMSGSGWAYAWRACLWTFATFFTLGLLLPWRESALERYKMRHLHYGDLPARFEGTGWTLFKRGWWLWLLSFPLITIPFVYPAYRAILWRWWIDGVRIGAVRFESAMRTGGLNRLYWATIGWIVLFMSLAGAALGIVTAALPHLIGAPAGAAGVMWLIRQHSILMFALYIANYLAIALFASFVVRIYLVRGVWERVVTSATVHNLESADDVRAMGDLASALGEGLADGLDVAGF